MNTKHCSEYDVVTAYEVALIYHYVKHNQSYASLDCGNKITFTIFNDSIVANKLSCGRTKSESIVKNVLAQNV